jgi:hypothetical protein
MFRQTTCEGMPHSIGKRFILRVFEGGSATRVPNVMCHHGFHDWVMGDGYD